MDVTSPQSTPSQANTHIHIVSQPYFEIDGDNIGGQMRALMKYAMTNESAQQYVEVTEYITAGANDVLADDALESITSGGTTAVLEEDTTIGLRFTNVSVPQGASVSHATLYCTPDDAAPSGTSSNVVISVTAEDADNSAAFSTWANFDARSRTTRYSMIGVDTKEFYNQRDKLISLGDVYPPVSEVVNRTGWTSGNALTLFLTDFYGWDSADELEFDMYETSANSWALEIVYLSSGRYTSSVYMGSRSTSRGEDFRAFINTHSDNQPTGIYIAPGLFAGWENRTFYNGAYVPQGQVIMVTGSHLYNSFDDRVTARIYAPLSTEYEGRFRAFVRAGILDHTAGESALIRLRVQAGSGSSVYTNETAILETFGPDLIDLGPVSVPRSISGADSLSFTIQTKTEDEIVIYLFAIILVPIDEWYLEATQPEGVGVSLDSSTYLLVDSINSSPEPVVASINQKATTSKIVDMIMAGTPATLAAGRTQRVWVATTADLSQFAGDPNNPSGNKGSYTDIVHKVTAESVFRYLGMRGEE
jgi:hypothetical protein